MIISDAGVIKYLLGGNVKRFYFKDFKRERKPFLQRAQGSPKRNRYNYQGMKWVIPEGILAFPTKRLVHELEIRSNTPTAWLQSRRNRILHLNFINLVFSFPT